MSDAALTDLISSSMGNMLWNSTAILSKASGTVANNLNSICRIARILAVIPFLIQLIIQVWQGAKSRQIWENLGTLMFRTLLIMLLVTPLLYTTVFRWLIAEPANLVAESITTTYITDFQEGWANVWAGTSEEPSKPWSFITAGLDSVLSTLVSGVLFIAAAICVFVVSLLQPYLFLFLFYAGPLCLIFSLCDLTTHIAKNWLGTFLTVCFVGVFGSLAFLTANAAGLATHLSPDSTANNFLVVAIYSVLAVTFFMTIWPITAGIFNGVSAIGTHATPQAFIQDSSRMTMMPFRGGVLAASAYYSGMNMAGKTMAKISHQGTAMGRMAQGMVSTSTVGLHRSSAVMEALSGYGTAASALATAVTGRTREAALFSGISSIKSKARTTEAPRMPFKQSGNDAVQKSGEVGLSASTPSEEAIKPNIDQQNSIPSIHDTPAKPTDGV